MVFYESKWIFYCTSYFSPDVREFLSLDNPKNSVQTNDEDPGTDDTGDTGDAPPVSNCEIFRI
jgi:hypothetical protein